MHRAGARRAGLLAHVRQLVGHDPEPLRPVQRRHRPAQVDVVAPGERLRADGPRQLVGAISAVQPHVAERPAERPREGGTRARRDRRPPTRARHRVAEARRCRRGAGVAGRVDLRRRLLVLRLLPRFDDALADLLTLLGIRRDPAHGRSGVGRRRLERREALDHPVGDPLGLALGRVPRTAHPQPVAPTRVAARMDADVAEPAAGAAVDRATRGLVAGLRHLEPDVLATDAGGKGRAFGHGRGDPAAHRRPPVVGTYVACSTRQLWSEK